MKGIQSDLKMSRATSVEELMENTNNNDKSSSSKNNTIYREYIAAVCVQALMSLGWDDNRVIQIEQSSSEDDPMTTMIDNKGGKKVVLQKEWCVNSSILQNSLAALS
ncbi:MAG: hypothetical protein ACI8RD_002302 [Bacillariaceae sp.]|jgi:hypothetical protein